MSINSLMSPNLSEKEKQNIFLETYRASESKNKTIKKVCEYLNLPRSEFNLWLCDPEFEEVFFAELRASTYSLTESLLVNAAELLEEEVSITKGRFMALQIAQKSVLETIGRLNRDRFAESSELTIKGSANCIPNINISLISADTPSILASYETSIEIDKEAIRTSLVNDPIKELEHKKGANKAPIIELKKID